MTTKEQKLKDAAEQVVNQFNEQFPIGSKVMHKKIASKSIPFEERIVKSSAFVSNSYDPVAFFVGLSGYYIITPQFIKYS